MHIRVYACPIFFPSFPFYLLCTINGEAIFVLLPLMFFPLSILPSDIFPK